MSIGRNSKVLSECLYPHLFNEITGLHVVLRYLLYYSVVTAYRSQKHTQTFSAGKRFHADST